MSSPTQPPAKSGKPWLWIVFGVLAVLFLICGGTCAGCLYLGQQGIEKAKEAAEVLPITTQALSPISADPTVQEKLGDSIVLGGMPKRQGAGPIDYANTVVLFDVQGSKGMATATVHAKQTNGAWEITNIKIQFSDGSTTEVAPPESGPPQLEF